MSRAVAGVLLAAALLGACARPGSPPGGPVDRSPPRVVETVPAAFDTLTDMRARVVIRFDERISERLEGVTELRDAVLISPVTGEPRADRKRRSIEIIPAGGWEPDRAYRVVVLPVFRDLFGNQRRQPIELVFSTGGPIPDAAIAGFVQDRITGQAVPGARVEAVRHSDSTRYEAVTDTAGFFALRFMPAGTYDLRSWLDQNRDAAPDFFEAQDTAEAVFGVGDTAVVEMALLPMDTTPAQLARAEPVDSVRVRLVFDDYFAPGPVEGSAELFLASDSSLVSDDGHLIHSTTLDSILAAEAEAREARRAEEAARDSLQAIQDSLRAIQDSVPAAVAPDSGAVAGAEPPDTVRPPVDTAAARAAAQAGRAGGRAPAEARTGQAVRQRPGQQGPPRPSRELILVLPEPLLPDTSYYVVVQGVVNIRGVPGGGGSAPFRTPPPPADTATADTAVIDSAAAPPDSVGGAVGVPPDSGAATGTARSNTVPPDTIPPDTIPPDTIPPDTIPPDTIRPGLLVPPGLAAGGKTPR